MQRQLVLLIGIPVVGSADVRGAVAQNDVGAGALHFGADGRLAFFGGDVADEGDHVFGIEGANGEDVDGEDGGGGVLGEGAGADLGPAAGGGAEVDDGFGIL